MARSSFYYHLDRSRQPDKHAVLHRRILALFHAHKGRYGYRRITLALHNEGYAVDHKTVERIMRELEEYIHYYNNDRIKTKLKGMSPVKYRTHSLQI